MIGLSSSPDTMRCIVGRHIEFDEGLSTLRLMFVTNLLLMFVNNVVFRKYNTLIHIFANPQSYSFTRFCTSWTGPLQRYIVNTYLLCISDGGLR